LVKKQFVVYKQGIGADYSHSRMWQGGIMVTWMKTAGLLLSGTIAAGMYGNLAYAADISAPTSLPAVSAPNGKLEFGAGWVDLNNLSSDTEFRGGASISFPVGDMFGIQGDLAVVDAFSDTAVGGTVHFFTRDPNSYLLGMIGGYADVGQVNAWYVGPEVELYLNNISIEAVGGYIDPHGGANSKNLFAMGDLALYATDDLRLSVGARSVTGFESAHAGLEWYMGQTVGIPASFTLDGRVGEHGFTSIMAGFSLYFGGEDKSLIRRHREDDPRNRSLDIFAATAGGALLGGGTEDAVCVENVNTETIECPLPPGPQ
jgi:hypothetical protein